MGDGGADGVEVEVTGWHWTSWADGAADGDGGSSVLTLDAVQW